MSEERAPDGEEAEPTEEELLTHQQQHYDEERRIFRELDEALKGVLDLLVEHPILWQSGDGCGGHVLHRLVEGAAARGLDIKHTKHQPTDLVELLGKRDGWNCHCCGILLAGAPGVPWPEADHVIPKSMGGPDHINNRTLACPSCNSAKGAKNAEDFLAYRARRGAR